MENNVSKNKISRYKSKILQLEIKIKKNENFLKLLHWAELQHFVQLKMHKQQQMRVATSLRSAQKKVEINSILFSLLLCNRKT